MWFANKDEKIMIDVVARDDVDALVQQLTVLGMENISIYGRMISGLIPVASLEQTAALTTLKFARPSYAKASTGSVTSQGDAALLSDDARSIYGVDGTGITIGTLSDSYSCIGAAAADIASNDLPSGVKVLADETGCASGTDEGRAWCVATGCRIVFIKSRYWSRKITRCLSTCSRKPSSVVHGLEVFTVCG